MERTRIKLAVYIDLDPVPGAFHSAESAKSIIHKMLVLQIGHYNPMVSIESCDIDKKT